MAGLYIKNLDDGLKAWLEERAKAEGFSTLSGYIKVHFTRLMNKAQHNEYFEVVANKTIPTTFRKPLNIAEFLPDQRYCYNCFCATDNVPAGMDDQCMFFNKSLNSNDLEGNTPRLQECIDRFGVYENIETGRIENSSHVEEKE